MMLLVEIYLLFFKKDKRPSFKLTKLKTSEHVLVKYCFIVVKIMQHSFKYLLLIPS